MNEWIEKNKLLLAGGFVVVVGGLALYGAFSPKQRALREKERRYEDQMMRRVGLDPEAVRLVSRFTAQ